MFWMLQAPFRLGAPWSRVAYIACVLVGSREGTWWEHSPAPPPPPPPLPIRSWFESGPSWNHMWVEFVVGSRPCSDGFPPCSPVFFCLRKTQHSFWKQWMKSRCLGMPLQIRDISFFSRIPFSRIYKGNENWFEKSGIKLQVSMSYQRETKISRGNGKIWRIEAG